MKSYFRSVGFLRQLIVALLAVSFFVSCSSEKNKRLKWNLETTVRNYEEHGKHDSKWDAAAKEALTLFAQWRAGDSNDSSLVEKIAAQSKAAVDAGCKDAMVLYLYARFVVNQPGHTQEEIVRAHQKATAKLKDSEYPPLRRFHACLRTGEALNRVEKVSHLAVTEIMNDAASFLAESFEDGDIPHSELYVAARAYLRCNEKMNAIRQGGWQQLDAALRKKWGDDYQNDLAGVEPKID